MLNDVERYWRLWQTYDVDALTGFFECDARYEIIGNRVLQGIDEIRAYWINNSRVQHDLRLESGPVFETQNESVARWSAVFGRRDRAAWYQLEGILWLRRNPQGLVTLLTEAYSKEIIPYQTKDGDSVA